MKRIIIPSILRYMAHFIQHISSVTKYLQSISQFQINRNNYNYLVINSNQISFSLASFQYNDRNIYNIYIFFTTSSQERKISILIYLIVLQQFFQQILL